MPKTLAEKILDEHIVDGHPEKGTEVGIKIDQTLTQDATGTMAYLQFEALGIPRVKTKLSVSYVDHNTLQSGFENADDHKFLQSTAAKFGVYFSRAGNGICHQVHLERFAVPGDTLLGSDSHTPTAGGLGMIAMGAGGLDVAVAMGGGPFYLTYPKIFNVELTGKLNPYVTAKDVILEVLRQLTVKGGVGYIMEYSGPGVKSLSIPERATITNMGAELGATTSVFPVDEISRDFLVKQQKEHYYKKMEADPGAKYDKKISIDLSKLTPLVAKPHMPDQVVSVSELKGTKVDQVAIGSCTNSSYKDLYTVAKLLKGKQVHRDVSLVVAPGSKQVYEMAARAGFIADIIAAGARIQESACGFCIGMGQSPNTNAVSVRTNNRNFEGRSGTKSAGIYLTSPETAVACALTAKMTDPAEYFKEKIDYQDPKEYIINDNMIVFPDKPGGEIYRGPNIKPLPINEQMPDNIEGKILLKVEDNITTDHIMPAGSKILPLRSNIPAISEYVFSGIDKEFSKRAQSSGGGFVVGGTNYGQGSSREHAALAPMYLKVKGVITKSFARIHKANLINFGILPLVFENESDYNKIKKDSKIVLKNIKKTLVAGDTEITAEIDGQKVPLKIDVVADRQLKILLAGGLLNYTKANQK